MFDLLGYKWGSSTGGTASGTISWNADDLLSDLDLDAGVLFTPSPDEMLHLAKPLHVGFVCSVLTDFEATIRFQ